MMQCFHKGPQLRTWSSWGPNCWNGPHLVLILHKSPQFAHFLLSLVGGGQAQTHSLLPQKLWHGFSVSWEWAQCAQLVITVVGPTRYYTVDFTLALYLPHCCLGRCVTQPEAPKAGTLGRDCIATVAEHWSGHNWWWNVSEILMLDSSAELSFDILNFKLTIAASS